MTKTGPGTVSFDGALNQNVSNIFAQTTVQEGVFEVAHNAIYGVNAPNTSFTVNPGAILQGGVAGTVGASQFTLQSGAMFNIAGNAPPSEGFSVFTIDAAQASFESGSRILFNTELNDASVQHTDLLVLNHAITDAPGGIVVTNFGGAGGVTGDRDGIRLVEAISGATTTPNNFTLLNGELRAGAFTYDLFRGGLNPSNFSNDWFLRSSFVAPPIPPEPPVVPPVVRRFSRRSCRRGPRSCRRRRRRIPCRPASPFRSSGPNSQPMGWCSRWPGSWGFRSSAPSTTGSATPTSPTVAPFSPRPPPRRLLRSTCRPRSRPLCRPGSPGLRPARSFRPRSGAASSAKHLTTTTAPSLIPRASGNMGGFQGGIDLLRGSLIAGQY